MTYARTVFPKKVTFWGSSWTWIGRHCCSVAKSRLTLCDPVDCSTSDFPVLYHLPEFAQTPVHWVSDTIQPWHPLSPPSPLPSIFPSIRAFSSESALHIKWPEYWSFNLSISPSNLYSGLRSFRIDWFDFLAVQRTLKSLFCIKSKASILPCSAFFMVLLVILSAGWEYHQLI